MELIHADNLSFKYESQVESVFERVSFRVDSRSRIGLIGNNGCGKTTLFDLIRTTLRPTAGTLVTRPDTALGYLPQEVAYDDETTAFDLLWEARPDLRDLRRRLDDADPESLPYASLVAQYYERGGGLFEAQISRMVAGFRLDEATLAMPLHQLSGGEKTKTALARLLLTEPDCLLLDEPTNHLEIAALEWLEDYLTGVTLPFVVISHDRRFLDNCTAEIWELANGSLTVHAGNYSDFRKRKEAAFRRQQESFEQTRKTVKRLRDAATVRRQNAQKAEGFKHERAISNRGSVQKRDAGSGRAGPSSTSQMRSAKSVEKRIERLIESEEAKKPFLEKERKIDLGERSFGNRIVLTVSDLSKAFDGSVVFDSLNLTVANGARLGIIGGNGSGKTTLLRILAGAIDASSGEFHWAPQAKLGYYSQEHETLDPSRTILDEVLDGRVGEQALARTILGRLHIRRDKVFQSIGSLSLGERSKTALAKILFSDANVFVFDEPTNHMELQAREAFEDALDRFTGTLLLVSHDRYLLQRVVTEILDLDTGEHFPGGYDEYIASRTAPPT